MKNSIKKIYHKIKNEKGLAIVQVVAIVAVVGILTGSVIGMVNVNLKMAKEQEFYMESHYLVYSGVQMAIASLTAEGPNLTLMMDSMGIGETVGPEEIKLDDGIIRVSATKTAYTKAEIKSEGTIVRAGKTYTQSKKVIFDRMDPEALDWKNY